jgi:hypothetical protein
MRTVNGLERYAVVSCHAESPLDDRCWAPFERLLRGRPGGFAVTPFLRPPDLEAGEDGDLWLERARIAASLAPLGHHTHWGGPKEARPPAGVDAAAAVAAETTWLRAHGLEPRFFCGGGWYLDAPLAETLAEHAYVDCTATTFRQSYLAPDAPRLQVAVPVRLRLPSGASLLELPATHSLGMLGRDLLRVRGPVHVHFHDWELVDRRRSTALGWLLRYLGLRFSALTLAELADRAGYAVREIAWDEATIAR